MAELSPKLTENENLQWILHVNGSSNNKSCGAGVILEDPGRVLLEQSLKFSFKTSNNQVEYKAILVELTLAHDMKARQVLCKIESQLVVVQVKWEFEVKESLLQKYYHLILNLISKFDFVKIEHIRREDNVRTDGCMTITEEETWMTLIQCFFREWRVRITRRKNHEATNFTICLHWSRSILMRVHSAFVELHLQRPGRLHHPKNSQRSMW